MRAAVYLQWMCDGASFEYSDDNLPRDILFLRRQFQMYHEKDYEVLHIALWTFFLFRSMIKVKTMPQKQISCVKTNWINGMFHSLS